MIRVHRRNRYFNPRSSEGATPLPSSSVPALRFQSTLQRRSDCMCRTCAGPLFYFNPRSSEGATYCKGFVSNALHNFNPRSSEGATSRSRQQRRRCKMSIHAPAKERLYGSGSDSIQTDFNPRSSEGATGANRCIKRGANNFNPRSSEGATQQAVPLNPCLVISIHAPAKERPLSVFSV